MPGTTAGSSSAAATAKAKSGLAAVKAAVRQSDDMFTDMFGEKCLVSGYLLVTVTHSIHQLNLTS